MGLVTDPAAPRGDGPVNVFLIDLKLVTIETEFFNGHNKPVRVGVVAGITKPGFKRSMAQILSFDDNSLFPGLRLLREGGYFVGIGHTIDEKTKDFVSAPRFTPGKRRKDKNTKKYSTPLFHELPISKT